MAKKYGGFNLSKLRFYVEQVRYPNCELILYIDEGDVHPRQVKYWVSASFNCRISPESMFWQNEEYHPNVRAWCVKQATKLELFDKLRKEVYECNGREDPKQKVR